MGLFTIKNNIVQINPDNLAIPEFRDIWEADKSKSKEYAYKALSYVYFLCDYRSPYYSYPEDVRELQVIKDFVRDPNWIVTEHIKQACKKYEEFQNTLPIRMVKAGRKAGEEYINFFTNEGYNHKNFTSNLEKMGNIMKSLDVLEERAKKEDKNEEKIRGGGEILDRER